MTVLNQSESLAMKTVQKFTSFEDLKSTECKTGDNRSNSKRHEDFEKVVRSIYAAKVHPGNDKQLK